MFTHAIDCDMGLDCTCEGVCSYCAGEGRAEDGVCPHCKGSGADPDGFEQTEWQIEAELEREREARAANPEPITLEELDDLTSGPQ